MFTCTENLKHLCKSENVFGDGTFNYAPNYFYQLYTIHIFKNNYYIPVVYAFLTSKSENQYISMWLEIKKLCLALTGKIIYVRKFHSDFEIAAHNAIINSFPGCQLMCCQCHLTQCWFRQIQKNKILL